MRIEDKETLYELIDSIEIKYEHGRNHLYRNLLYDNTIYGDKSLSGVGEQLGSITLLMLRISPSSIWCRIMSDNICKSVGSKKSQTLVNLPVDIGQLKEGFKGDMSYFTECKEEINAFFNLAIRLSETSALCML